MVTLLPYPLRNAHTKTWLSRQVLILVSLAAMAMPSVVRADFIGPYAPGNWTLTNTGGSDGFVDTSGAPASIFVIGGDSGSGSDGTTNFTIAAVASGFVSFDWAYSSMDDPTFDAAQFLLNGVPTFLSFTNGESGSLSVPVNAGDVFGFQIYSGDNLFGPGVLNISNFNAPLGSVPDTGGTLLLLSLGALGIAVFRRRTCATS